MDELTVLIDFKRVIVSNVWMNCDRYRDDMGFTRFHSEKHCTRPSPRWAEPDQPDHTWKCEKSTAINSRNEEDYLSVTRTDPTIRTNKSCRERASEVEGNYTGFSTRLFWSPVPEHQWPWASLSNAPEFYHETITDNWRALTSSQQELNDVMGS